VALLVIRGFFGRAMWMTLALRLNISRHDRTTISDVFWKCHDDSCSHLRV